MKLKRKMLSLADQDETAVIDNIETAGRTELELICRYGELEKVDYLIRYIKHRQRIVPAILFLFDDWIYAYINHCIHNHQRLDCEADTVFDRSGRFLHCSMHGCIFEPTTGECISPVCAGEKLQSLQLIRKDQDVFLNEVGMERVDPLN